MGHISESVQMFSLSGLYCQIQKIDIVLPVDEMKSTDAIQLSEYTISCFAEASSKRPEMYHAS